MKTKQITCFNSRIVLQATLSFAVIAVTPWIVAQSETPRGPGTEIVVTAVAGGNSATPVPGIQRNDVRVQVKGKTAEVTGWQKLVAAGDQTQLVVLIDDSLKAKVSINFNDLRDFIQKLPSSTQVAIGYMQYGRAVMATDFSTDRAATGKAIRLPSGIPGGNASPYFCLSDLAKNWPDKGKPATSRVALVITDGIDRYYRAGQFDPQDPYVAAAIRDAQVNRIMISSIYFGDAGIGSVGGSMNSAFVGQNYLQMVAAGTGGTMYFEGISNPVTFVPFLKDLNRQLANQYEVNFQGVGSGLQQIKISTETPRVKLAAPQRVVMGQQIPSAGN